MDHSHIKDRPVQEHCHRVHQILKIELNSKNKITALNNSAVPVQVYSFGIDSWLRKDTEKMDSKTRKLLTIERI